MPPLPSADDELAELLLFLNAAPLGLMAVRDDGTVTLANAACARLLLPLNAGRALFNLFTLLAEVRPGLDLAADVAARGSTPGLIHDGLRLPLPAAGGPARVLALRLERLAADRLIATLTDVSAQVQAEQAQAEAAAQAEEARRLQQLGHLKSRFLATMTHELRTPLTVVLGFVELMRRGRLVPGSPQETNVLARIANNGGHLLRLIDDVLDLAHIEAGRLQLRPALFDLQVLVDEVAATLAPQRQARRQTLAVQVDAGLDALMLDPDRLRQVLWHLLSNAVKFTPDGGSLALQARPLPADDGPPRFELLVRDAGHGIPATLQAQVFERFHQLDNGNGRLHEGAGIGLALTRALVQAHGGEIALHSDPGQGSTFIVRLPLVLEGEAEHHEAGTTGR
ncbi:HAMP domain-containing sensor histidine kinase [Ideonella sp. DXS22W]|uniref:histidine kinase n=1 Tax=Pseudaquabacterium inlustre TaxID=2984192 RepID=A0ABU9CMK7_9BURK